MFYIKVTHEPTCLNRSSNRAYSSCSLIILFLSLYLTADSVVCLPSECSSLPSIPCLRREAIWASSNLICKNNTNMKMRKKANINVQIVFRKRPWEEKVKDKVVPVFKHHKMMVWKTVLRYSATFINTVLASGGQLWVLAPCTRTIRWRSTNFSKYLEATSKF